MSDPKGDVVWCSGVNPFWAVRKYRHWLHVMNICIILSQRGWICIFRSLWFFLGLGSVLTRRSSTTPTGWSSFMKPLPNRTKLCGLFLVILCPSKEKHISRHISFQSLNEYCFDFTIFFHESPLLRLINYKAFLSSRAEIQTLSKWPRKQHANIPKDWHLNPFKMKTKRNCKKKLHRSLYWASWWLTFAVQVLCDQRGHVDVAHGRLWRNGRENQR